MNLHFHHISLDATAHTEIMYASVGQVFQERIIKQRDSVLIHSSHL